MAERDYQAELQAGQAAVKRLGSKREKMVGDVRVEADRVTQAVTGLQAIGIEKADKMSVKDLQAFRETSQQKLNDQLDALKEEVAAAEAVVKEYDAVAA